MRSIFRPLSEPMSHTQTDTALERPCDWGGWGSVTLENSLEALHSTIPDVAFPYATSVEATSRSPHSRSTAATRRRGLDGSSAFLDKHRDSPEKHSGPH